MGDPQRGGRNAAVHSVTAGDCRAEASPDVLNAALNTALTEVGKQQPQLFLRLEHLEHFRSGKPQLTHRDA